jgi:hypothetical protein
MLSHAQAVVVLFTKEDERQTIKQEWLRQDRADNGAGSASLPLSVLFGLALILSARYADRTILVQVGEESHCYLCPQRMPLSNHLKHRWEFMKRLYAAGCQVERPSNEVLRTIGNFSIE